MPGVTHGEQRHDPLQHTQHATPLTSATARVQDPSSSYRVAVLLCTKTARHKHSPGESGSTAAAPAAVSALCSSRSPLLPRPLLLLLPRLLLPLMLSTAAACLVASESSPPKLQGYEPAHVTAGHTHTRWHKTSHELARWVGQLSNASKHCSYVALPRAQTLAILVQVSGSIQSAMCLPLTHACNMCQLPCDHTHLQRHTWASGPVTAVAA